MGHGRLGRRLGCRQWLGDDGAFVTSLFSWVDYSEQDRARMAEVIELFREQDTRDELGIGVIRDAFADMLFPGTNTMQTRARYFLFVPWMYRRLEVHGFRSVDMPNRTRKDETALIKALMAAGETDAVIGRVSQERLQRMPSNIYWLGLGVWGIRQFDGSQPQYHRSIDGWRRRQTQRLRGDDGGAILGNPGANWDPALPPEPEEFPEGARFALTVAEAEYLRDKIAVSPSTRDTLLRHLVVKGRPWEGETDFVWNHPEADAFPEEPQRRVAHARAFSEAIFGGPLLYNLMLAELSRSDARIDQYRAELTAWRTMLEARADALRAWDQRAFWSLLEHLETRVHPRARAFVREWTRFALAAADGRDVSDDVAARRLIEEREKRLKGGLSRLTNRRALETWSGAAGTHRLNYRWGVAQPIIRDILAGLEGVAHA